MLKMDMKTAGVAPSIGRDEADPEREQKKIDDLIFDLLI